MEEPHESLVRKRNKSPRAQRYKFTRKAKLLGSPDCVRDFSKHDGMEVKLMPGQKRRYHNVRHAVMRPAILGDFPIRPQTAFIPPRAADNEGKQMLEVARFDKGVSQRPIFPSLPFDVFSSSEAPWQKWEDMRVIMDLIEVTS